MTLRRRVTLLYSGLVFAASLVMVAVTYLLTVERPAVAPTSLLAQGGIALVAIGVLAAGTAWLVAGRVLAPLHEVTHTAQRIVHAPARGLYERLSVDHPADEIKELADTFDAMLDRLDHSFDDQRRFVANASRELRTPLTLNRALLEVAMRKSAAPEVQQLGQTLLEINSQHERLIDGLILLARAEHEIQHRVPIDLADLVRHVAQRDVHGGLAPAQTMGDPVLLERLVLDLVENAYKHNLPADGWVRVSTSVRDGRAELVVANNGPLIPPYDVPALFEPFRRPGADREGGLGLSVVRSVATVHGGFVRAEPRSEGGLIVTVTL